MYDSEILNELRRIDFEDFVWGVFALLCIINIYGDYNEKEYLKRHDESFKTRSNYIFEITLISTFLIYIYFFIRNYKAYQKCSKEKKKLFLVKVLSSCFSLVASLCLIFVQTKQLHKK